jgi:hypothetical protein
LDGIEEWERQLRMNGNWNAMDADVPVLQQSPNIICLNGIGKDDFFLPDQNRTGWIEMEWGWFYRDHFTYDTTWGGLITTKAMDDGGADFGQEIPAFPQFCFFPLLFILPHAIEYHLRHELKQMLYVQRNSFLSRQLM